MDKNGKYKDIGEGMSIKITSDAEYTIRNNQTGKERTFVSSDSKLLVDDNDIDFDAIKAIYDRDKAYEKSAQYGFHRVADFKDGICRLMWIIYPDGMYFADSDGYGMKDNSEERAICTINKDLEIIEPFRPENYKPKSPSEQNNTEIVDQEPIDEVVVNLLEDFIVDDGQKQDYIEKPQKYSNLEEYIDEVHKSLDEFDRGRRMIYDNIRLLKDRFDFKQFEYNVMAFRVGNCYTIINTLNGISRVLVNEKGLCLFSSSEDPNEVCKDAFIKIDSFCSIVNSCVPKISLECKYVSKTGFSLIHLKEYYPCDGPTIEEIYDSYGDISYVMVEQFHENYYGQPMGFSDYFCVLDQEFKVVVPIKPLRNTRKFYDPNLFSEEEWKQIWEN